jgi:hypothetical protein
LKQVLRKENDQLGSNDAEQTLSAYSITDENGLQLPSGDNHALFCAQADPVDISCHFSCATENNGFATPRQLSEHAKKCLC